MKLALLGGVIKAPSLMSVCCLSVSESLPMRAVIGWNGLSVIPTLGLVVKRNRLPVVGFLAHRSECRREVA